MTKLNVIFIGIVSYKGGVGKTNTAINLARAFADLGLKTLLIDDDDKNYSSVNWGTRRGTNDPFTVISMFDASQYLEPRDVVIYDTPGGMDKAEMTTIGKRCSFVVVPCKPDQESMDATLRLAGDLQSIDAKFKVLATDCHAGGSFGRAHGMLDYYDRANIPHFGSFNDRNVPEGIIPSSMKFKDATATGRHIGEVSGGELFARTFTALAQQILKEVGYEPKLTEMEVDELTENIRVNAA